MSTSKAKTASDLFAKDGFSLIQEGKIDFGKQSQDYSRYRPGFPPRFYHKVSSVLSTDSEGRSTPWSWSGKHVLDLASGPGIMGFEIVKLGSTVIGVDIAKNQIEAAKAIAKERGVEDKAQFYVATAENTEQKAESFDAIVAGQCWHWFKHDLAMAEARRVLKPGGVLVVCHFDYQPKLSAVAKDTEDLILKYNPKWKFAGGDGLYPSEIDQLVADGGFELVEQFTIDHVQLFSHEGWRGRMRTCNGVGSGGLTPEQIEAWDRDLAALLCERYPEEPVPVTHRIWAVIVRKQAAKPSRL